MKVQLTSLMDDVAPHEKNHFENVYGGKSTDFDSLRSTNICFSCFHNNKNFFHILIDSPKTTPSVESLRPKRKSGDRQREGGVSVCCLWALRGGPEPKGDVLILRACSSSVVAAQLPSARTLHGRVHAYNNFFFPF
jgi:hypothetical protein